MKFCLALPLFVCLSPCFAFADSAEARQHYEKATAHFAVGEFGEAAAEYQAAFKEKPDPALLYDAAQAYRLANNPEKALILYRNYMQLYPNEPNISEVRAQIEKLKDAVAAADKTKSGPPTGTNEPKQIATQANPSESTAPVATEHPEPRPSASIEGVRSVRADRPAQSMPVYKKWWLWTAVGVVLTGGVVVAAVLATQSRGTWSNAPDVGPGSTSGLSLAMVRW